MRGVIVRRGVTQLDIKLSAEAIEEIVVAPPDTATEATQVVRRRKRATVSDAISAEQISRSPDSSASDAAKRMVGATIQDGRYVVIRGLGGRYSLTLLNGVPYFFEKVMRLLQEEGKDNTPGALLEKLGGRLRSGISGGGPSGYRVVRWPCWSRARMTFSIANPFRARAGGRARAATATGRGRSRTG